MIPRLPPADNSISVTITVNEKLRPYFERWFQRERNPGETPEQFALRILKIAALNTYIGFEAPTIQTQIDEAKEASIAQLNEDIQTLGNEVA